MRSQIVWLFVIAFYSILKLLIIWARSRSFKLTPFCCWNKCNGIGWRARSCACILCFVFRSLIRTECYIKHCCLCLYRCIRGVYVVWCECTSACVRSSLYVFDRVFSSSSYNNTSKCFTFVSHWVILLDWTLRF